MEMSYQSMKIAHQAREAEELRTETRKKNLLVLIYHHLLGQGYVAAAMALDQETNGGMKKFEVCDNIDLEMMLIEYESYHHVKFQKYPKLIRRAAEPGTKSPLKHSAMFSSINENQLSVSTVLISCIRLFFYIDENKQTKTDIVIVLSTMFFVLFFLLQERLLKPLSGFSGMSGEMKELAAIISRDIYLHSPNVRWEDIIGLEDAKRLVKEAVVCPIKYPWLFTGILSPWKGLLLYGPPGTGKTLLAKAVATECKTTFFNISASSIVSKWRGDSEKLVRVLFELARYHAPSTIFLDELESVMGQRGTSLGGEHEGSRRMKTELLVQMDGLARSEDLVFVLAASNLPWELDHAMLRRLEKRILVNLPSSAARQAMMSHWLPPLSSIGEIELRTELDYETLAEEMEGYSGSDIRLVCKEAAMKPVRKLINALESHQNADTDTPVIQLGTVTTADFMEAISHTKPSARNLMDRHTAWDREYESV
uniref:Katanin p60 ATPase-containing subunit A-like 2 n=1 Tax=Kryptolebias marmoratus TaxID=37003 RepID=A0A3Q3G8H0_KRYMA